MKLPVGILILFSVLLFVQCKKKVLVQPSLTSVYTKQIAGKRTWQHSIYCNIQGKETNTTFNDSSVAIEVINDTTIKFLNVTLIYTNKNVTVYGYGAIVDTNIKLDYVAGADHNFSHVAFYYKKDSIIYNYNSGGLGGSCTESYHTY